MHLMRGLSWLSVQIFERDICGGSALVPRRRPPRPPFQHSSRTDGLHRLSDAYLTSSGTFKTCERKVDDGKNKKSLRDSLVPTFSWGVCRSDAHSVPTRCWFLRRLHHFLPPLFGSDFLIRWCPFPRGQGMPYGPIQAGPPPGLTSLPTCPARPLCDPSFFYLRPPCNFRAVTFRAPQNVLFRASSPVPSKGVRVAFH